MSADRHLARRVLRGSIRVVNGIHRGITSPKALGDIRRVVIFCPYSGLGNLLLWIPALRALHNRWPGVEIIMAGQGEDMAWPLFKSGLISKALPFRKVAFDTIFRQSRYIMEHVRPFSPNVALLTSLEPPRQASIWALLSGARVRIGFGGLDESLLLTTCIAPRFDIHEIKRNFILLEPLGISGDLPSAGFDPDEDDLKWADKFLSEQRMPSLRVGLHPGSAGGMRERRKRWPIDRFIGVARSLAEEGVGVVVFGGPDDVEEMAAVEEALGEKISVVRGENIGRVSALLSRMNVVVANDSGLMHLSAAVGTPVVAIFGPTDAVKNSPWTDKSSVIKRPCLHAPCYLMPDAPCEDRLDCLKGIAIGEVLAAAHKFLEK